MLNSFCTNFPTESLRSEWAKGVKSLYYCRSKSIQRAESAASWHRTKMANDAEPKQLELGEEPKKYEECLACQ